MVSGRAVLPSSEAPEQGKPKIAVELDISSKPVGTHIQHVLSELGVDTRSQAVSVAFRRGLAGSDVRAHALALLDA